MWIYLLSEWNYFFLNEIKVDFNKTKYFHLVFFSPRVSVRPSFVAAGDEIRQK